MISSILSRLSVFNYGSVWALYLLHVIIRTALSCSLDILSDLKPYDNTQYCRWGSIKLLYTVYPKKYAHGFCFAVLCCGYTLTDFPTSIRLTSLALWQSNDCPSASKATLMNMDKYFMWIHYERLHNHNKAKHNKTVYIFLGMYCKIRNTFSDKNLFNLHQVILISCLIFFVHVHSMSNADRLSNLRN